jgi:hypothetical protein
MSILGRKQNRSNRSVRLGDDIELRIRIDPVGRENPISILDGTNVLLPVLVAKLSPITVRVTKNKGDGFDTQAFHGLYRSRGGNDSPKGKEGVKRDELWHGGSPEILPPPLEAGAKRLR